MNNLISDMNLLINAHVKCFFAVNLSTNIGNIKIFGWKLHKKENGGYYIDSPFEQYKDKKTGEQKLSKFVYIQTSEMYKIILDAAVSEFESKNRELITKFNKEHKNDDSIK